MRIRILALAMILCSSFVFAQDYFPKNSGVKSKNNNFTAFTHAKIHVTPTQIISDGTLLIQNGKVIQVGKSVSIPKNTVVIDLKGKYIYPSFIDVYSDFGVQKPKRAPGSGRSPQYEPTREGFYWNDHIMPENNAIDKFKYKDKDAEALRNIGFGVVNTHIHDGIARGTGVLVALNANGNDANRILDDKASQHFSFAKSIAKRQSYPTSLMGATALLRQLYYDVDWYSKGKVTTKDRSIEALLANKALPQIFEANNRTNALLADKIADKFQLNYTLIGGGDEYETVADIKATGAQFVIPINFPDPYDVSNPYHAKYISLEDMRHWNQAPSNPKILAENNVPFSITLFGLKSPQMFYAKLRKAIDRGLSKSKALEALTLVPAKILGKSNVLGSLQAGYLANFIISSGDIFEKSTTLYENWVQGQSHVIVNKDQKDIRANYEMTIGGLVYDLKIMGSAEKPKAKVFRDSTLLTSKFSYENSWMELSFTAKESEKTYRLISLIQENDRIDGKLVLPNGKETTFTAIKTEGFSEKVGQKDNEGENAVTVMPVTYPNVGYGYTKKPKAENLLFKNATVWTGEEAGILPNTDVLVKNGKIVKVGQNIKAGGAKVIDATNKHLTAGVIDEHSHIAALAVNEAGHNSSAEVQMEEVVNPKDMNIYRNLGGGVTSVQLLHGSANPIGGRSAILKLKWGESAEKMIYSNSPKFIKFALGENVKQSNWQSFNRFPQTRMGVEQVFVDFFQRAKEYEAQKNSGQPYRYDEEMEVLVEILNGERFISCHSYVQSEINMLIKVAEQFNFTINTFTHILEGYKVADKMAKHGVGGSTFSDWWAYKYEVNDAIPYNAAIMHNQGVTVAINSDDREMSRRLNQEAAKTIKYGGLSEEEAWKTVTLNPAKLLHIDHRVGSIKEGKDADLVLWSDHPLSMYAKAEKTIIEGATYFDLEKDKLQREAIQKERNILIHMMLQEKENGKKTQTPRRKENKNFQCNTL